MLLKIVYLLMRWSFGLIALLSRVDHAKDAELLVLRHENAGAAPECRAGAGRASRPGLVRRPLAVHPAPLLGRGLPRAA